jgi:ATP-dependent 26S proteasome regulatory subunit
MNTTATENWYEANQDYLLSALEALRCSLEKHIERLQDESGNVAGARSTHTLITSCRRLQDISERAEKDNLTEEAFLKEKPSSMPAPSALETLCRTFNLSQFERDLLLLCAGVELDSVFLSLCAEAQGDPRRTYPTFSLALAALPGAHWSAITPAEPLRYWHLIEPSGEDFLTLSKLCIDECILHYLAGVRYTDKRLASLIEPLTSAKELVASHRDLAEIIARTWFHATDRSTLPAVQLSGNDVSDKMIVAAAACDMLGLNPKVMAAESLPLTPDDLDDLIRLWDREAALNADALILDCDNLDETDRMRKRAIMQLINCVRSPLIVTSRNRLNLQRRRSVSFEVQRPTSHEQSTIWQNILDTVEAGSCGNSDSLVSQFDLSAETILTVSGEALPSIKKADAGRSASDNFQNLLWNLCRVQSRPRMDELAQRIEPAATWEDLVLMDQQKQILNEIAIHMKQRAKVYGRWGFASRSSLGLGISALFAGPSGTGKTMAAEVLANELQLDLYRIDLSQVMSKYIGETEKNLRRVFDSAEGGGAILLFDEADALFGKRSEVKDSHDRYANIEVSYLLQRMESYRGLAILTTNMKNSLDPAFMRRIRFIVQFPFPEPKQRAEIWRHIFPGETPTEGLDFEGLARLNVAGGSIRNIALNAAFLAAEEGDSVSMSHILRAARSEYCKMERPLTDNEIGGWI